MFGLADPISFCVSVVTLVVLPTTGIITVSNIVKLVKGEV